MPTTTHADAIYINGQFVTLDRQQPRANSVAIKDGNSLPLELMMMSFNIMARRQISSIYTTDKCCLACMIAISI